MASKRKRLKARKPIRRHYNSRYHRLLNLKKKGDSVTFMKPKGAKAGARARFAIYAAATYWLGASNISVFSNGTRFKVVLRRGR